MSVVRYGALGGYYQQLIMEANTPVAVAANGAAMEVIGQVILPVNVSGFQFNQLFTVVHSLTVDCILGADCLLQHQAIIDCKQHCVTMSGVKLPFLVQQVCTNNSEINLVSNAVKVFETVVIAGRTIHPLEVLLPTEVTTLGVSEVLIEQQSSNVPSHLLFPRTLSRVTRGGHAVVQVTNASPTDITLYKNTTLGHCTPVQNLLAISTDNCETQATPTPSSPVIDLSHCDLSQSQKQQLQELLNRYDNVFAHPGEPLGRTNMVKHPIRTSGAPIRQPMHRLPASLKDTVNSQIQDMLDTGVIQPSCSPWASPVVMVKKKDGTWRFCVDYRKVNAITHHDAYPLPRIDATLDSLTGSTLFTTLDLASGYWQVELESSDKEKTAFSTTKGHFEFNVMPFGLTNAPATFQRLMECVLAGISGELCLAYLDDIIVFSATFEEHLHRLAVVLQRLQAANLKLKPAKCHFAQSKVEYLGHIISGDGIQVDPKKTTAISDYPVPADVKQLKQFLGLTNYYRKFIQNYASIAEPLHKLLRKNSGGYVWNEQCQQSFNLLKQKLVSPPILTYPDFKSPFIVATDASSIAVGGVLSQVQGGAEKVIAYWSRQLQRAERNYSTIEREALAVVASIKEFYPYLYGFPFTVVTDHNPLTSLKGLKDTGGRLTRWLMFLQQFNFDLKYKQGSKHTNADALSRQKPTTPPVSVITNISPLSVSKDDLIQLQKEDSQLSAVREHIEQGTTLPKCPPGLLRCYLQEGVLCRQYKESSTGAIHVQFVIPQSLKDTIVKEAHGLGHLGIKKTLNIIKTRFYWPGYEADVDRWIKQCNECQRRNQPQRALPAPLETIQATYPFEKISWDIMGPLPSTPRGHQYMLLVTDLFTKWVEAFPLVDTTATTLATTLMNEVVCRYGVPAYLHSDQGANLCSTVVQELCRLLGIHRTRTSAYHPEGNGQVERMNRTVENMLAKVIAEDQQNWDLYLPKVLLAYRTSIHEVTGFTPYHLVFGQSPQLPIDVITGHVDNKKSQSYPQFVKQTHGYLKRAYTMARQRLTQQHQRRKQFHDKDGTAEELYIGDVVWLYTPVVKRGNTRKFSSFWKGPYTIVDKTGPVNYKLQLLGGTQTLVVHRNRIKPCNNPCDHLPTMSSSVSQTANSGPTGTTAQNAGIAGYTSSTDEASGSVGASTRPVRTHRLPTRFDNFVPS